MFTTLLFIFIIFHYVLCLCISVGYRHLSPEDIQSPGTLVYKLLWALCVLGILQSSARTSLTTEPLLQPHSTLFICLFVFWNKVSHQIQTGWPISPRNKLLSLPPRCVLLTLPFLCMCARNPNSGPSCLCGKHFSDWAISPALGF